MIRKSCFMISPFKENKIWFSLTRCLHVKSVRYVFWQWGIQFRPFVDIGFAKNAWQKHWVRYHLPCFYVRFFKIIGIMYFKVDHTEISRKRSDARSTSDMILCVFARLPNFDWLTRFKSTWEIMNAYPGNETICLRKLRSIKIKIVLTQRRWLIVYIYRAAKNSFMKNSEIILNT